ncbi:hypothetical protein DZG01_23745 [Pseudomonas fluorescens]|nr:hypothetical protein DZG01_23745 [Pseudomonas fluorescens]
MARELAPAGPRSGPKMMRPTEIIGQFGAAAPPSGSKLPRHRATPPPPLEVIRRTRPFPRMFAADQAFVHQILQTHIQRLHPQ